MTTFTKSTPVEIILPEGTIGHVLREQFRVASAYKVGHRIEMSGQTGNLPDLSLPESVEDEVAQAFVNATAVLAAGGASWNDVFSIRTYHVIPAGGNSIDSDSMGAVTATVAALMPDHCPAWTAVGVPALAFPGQRFEIEVTANA